MVPWYHGTKAESTKEFALDRQMDRLAAYAELQAHFAEIKDLHMRELFESDPGRFDKFSTRFEDIVLDCTG